MQKYYPIYLNLKDKNCLVAGGGRIALRKVRSLLDCQAKVRLVGLNVIRGIKKLKRKYKNFQYYERHFTSRDLKNIFLVIVATNDADTNIRITKDAALRGLLVNVVDNPGMCNFIVPSVFRRGNLSVSISTAGESPALAKIIRLDMERRYGAEYASLLKMLKTARKKTHGLPAARKKIIWKKIIAGIINE